MNGPRVQRHVTEGKNKDIVHVLIQNLNFPEEIAMEGVGKSSIAIKTHVLSQVSQVSPLRVKSKLTCSGIQIDIIRFAHFNLKDASMVI